MGDSKFDLIISREFEEELCHCNALERQDCYCFDRVSPRQHALMMIGIFAGVTGFWVTVLKLILG